MFNILAQITHFLPLRFEKIDYDGDTLIISGEKWRFTTNSVWRVSNGGKIIFTCWDNDAAISTKNLLGLSIIDILWLSDEIKIDPSFLLSDGKRLDVFCSYSCEPWIIDLPNGSVYVGNS